MKLKDFDWNTSFNLTIHGNKLINFPNLAHSVYANIFLIGQLIITLLRAFHFLGVNPSTGIYQFADAHGNACNFSCSAPTDLIVVGSTLPSFYGGLDNNIRFRGFTLDAFFSVCQTKRC